jgi:hypothetical protein
VDLAGAPSAVQGRFEDDKRSIGAGAASPDSLRIVLVQASDIRFFGAGLRPQPSWRVCEIAKPILYFGPSSSVVEVRAEADRLIAIAPRRNVGEYAFLCREGSDLVDAISTVGEQD